METIDLNKTELLEICGGSELSESIVFWCGWVAANCFNFGDADFTLKM